MKFYWLVTEKTQVTDGRKEGRMDGRTDGHAISISPSLFHRRGIIKVRATCESKYQALVLAQGVDELAWNKASQIKVRTTCVHNCYGVLPILAVSLPSQWSTVQEYGFLTLQVTD